MEQFSNAPEGQFQHLTSWLFLAWPLSVLYCTALQLPLSGVAAALLMAIRNVPTNVVDLLITTGLYLRLYVLGPFYFPPWIVAICILF